MQFYELGNVRKVFRIYIKDNWFDKIVVIWGEVEVASSVELKGLPNHSNKSNPSVLFGVIQGTWNSIRPQNTYMPFRCSQFEIIIGGRATITTPNCSRTNLRGGYPIRIELLSIPSKLNRTL